MAVAGMPTVLVEVDFANDGTWTTIAEGKFRAFSCTRGTSRADGPALRYEAGHLAVVFDNRTRDFDPTNLSGPYVSGGATQVVPGRPARLRATWATTTYPLWRGTTD